MALSARARARTALGLPPLAWFAFQQGMSHVVHVHCHVAGVVGPIAGFAALAVCVAAAVLARRLARYDLLSNYAWLCRLAVLGAAVFGLAIAFQTLATLMVPACVQ